MGQSAPSHSSSKSIHVSVKNSSAKGTCRIKKEPYSLGPNTLTSGYLEQVVSLRIDYCH